MDHGDEVDGMESKHPLYRGRWYDEISCNTLRTEHKVDYIATLRQRVDFVLLSLPSWSSSGVYGLILTCK